MKQYLKIYKPGKGMIYLFLFFICFPVGISIMRLIYGVESYMYLVMLLMLLLLIIEIVDLLEEKLLIQEPKTRKNNVSKTSEFYV
jgi:hypothetical protein